VSIRTVSRVLNRSPNVNRETRERVQQAIAELRFSPSPRARAMAMGRSFLIGMVHNDRNALVLDSVQRGVFDAAAARGYEVIMHPTPGQGEAAVEELVAFVRRSKADGVVVLPPLSGIDGLAAALAAEGVPAACLSPVPVEGYVAAVLSQERAASVAVAHHLVALGHRRVAMICGPADMPSARERREGFAAGLAEHGIVATGFEPGDYGFESGIAAAERLFVQDPRPTAIFAANDVMACGVLKAASRHGIAVPSRLSVVGFDGSVLAEMATPSLTTVSRPFGEMAREATARLIEALERDEAPATFAPHSLRLVPGESSAPPFSS
jgi:LacI family transcriptional regulator